MAATVASREIAVEGFSTDFFDEVRNTMLESLQRAAHDCVARAAQKLLEEMSRQQAQQQQEVVLLQSQLRLMSQRQHEMLNQSQQTEQLEEQVQPCVASASPARCPASPGTNMSDLKRRPTIRRNSKGTEDQCKSMASPTIKGDAIESKAWPSAEKKDLNHPLYIVDSRGQSDIACTQTPVRNETKADLSAALASIPVPSLMQTPSNHFTLVMTPTSSQTCSSGSSRKASPTRHMLGEEVCPAPAGSPSLLRTPTCAELLPTTAVRSIDIENIPSPTRSRAKKQQWPTPAAAEQDACMQDDLPLPPPLPGNASKIIAPASPSNDRTVIITEVTPPRAPPAAEKSKYGRPLQTVEQVSTADKTATFGMPLPLPLEQVLGPPREHGRSSLHSKQAADEAKTWVVKPASMQDDSPTVLEPDTIEILRAALMGELNDTGNDEVNVAGNSPKPSRAVMLPPAAMQGRNVPASCDSNGPTPQGSPLVRLAFETPRGSSPVKAVRTPKLGNIFHTPREAGTATPQASAQDAVLPQASPPRQSPEPKKDAVLPQASPPRQSPEPKSRRLSWPSSVRSPVRAIVGRAREVSMGSDDGVVPNSASSHNAVAETSSGTSEQESGVSKLQPVPPLAPLAPITPAEPATPVVTPKTMTEVEHEGAAVDTPGIHGVASPLRRRFFSVLGGAPSTSAVAPKPPAQRL